MNVQELDDIRWRMGHFLDALAEIRGKVIADALPDNNPLEFDPDAITKKLQDPHLLFVHTTYVEVKAMFDKFKEMTTDKGDE